MKELFCKICGKKRKVGRKTCDECSKIEARKRSKKRYLEKGRTIYKNICVACKKSFIAWHKEQELCRDCYRKSLSYSMGKNPYENGGSGTGKICWKHRRIAQDVLKRKLNTNEIVHHLDGDPKNNEVTNLIILSRSKHSALHRFLQKQRVIIEKSINENSENCWKTLIVPITTTWLETTSVKVIKIWEIGQSAAELLSSIE